MTPSDSPQPSGDASGKETDLSSFMDLSGKLVIVNGSVEAHVDGSPAVRIEGIEAGVTLNGYDGALDASVESGLPDRKSVV